MYLVGDDGRELAGVDRACLADDHALGRDEQKMAADLLGLRFERVDRAADIDLCIDKVIEFIHFVWQHHVGNVSILEFKIVKTVDPYPFVFVDLCFLRRDCKCCCSLTFNFSPVGILIDI